MTDKNIDLGTLVNVDMYYNYNVKESKRNSKDNSKTFSRTSCVNDSAPSALAVAPQAFQAVSDKDIERNNVCGLLGGNGSTTQNQPISQVPGYVRLDPQVHYDRISIQLGNYRVSGKNNRYRRSNVYVSLQESTKQTYNVFLTGAATNSKTELYRGAKNSQLVKDVIDTMFDQYPNIMIARLRYKPVGGFISDFHKPLTKSAILGINKEDDDFIAILFLYNEFIEIPLVDPLSNKQKGMYIAQGTFNDYLEFDDEEE